MTVPTFTPSVPSATEIAVIVPSSIASNSIVALSVSISAMMSPEATLSPTLTSHLASVPSSMVGESAGILISIGMVASGPLAVFNSVTSLAKSRGHGKILARNTFVADIPPQGSGRCGSIW